MTYAVIQTINHTEISRAISVINTLDCITGFGKDELNINIGIGIPKCCDIESSIDDSTTIIETVYFTTDSIPSRFFS